MAGPTAARSGTKGAPASGRAPAEPARAGRRLWPRLPFRRPGRRGLIITLILVLLLGGFGIWAFYGSDWLRVSGVKASGTRVLTAREVVDAAEVPLHTPLASVGTDAIAARLRHRLPRIKSVDVVRSWPHTIALKVTEREPELVMPEGGKYVEVDAEGVRFATVPAPPKGVPALQLAADDAPSLDRFGPARLRRAAVEVASDLPKSLHNQVKTVRVTSYDAITLELTGKRTVVWGSGEHGRRKAAVLTALLKAARDAHHFDVSVPSAPAVSGS
ncbi:FtsQ-type POTRA domain-containing protein [Streptomyces catenulae]|uniref:cell division protein FtsQ/DivIB n=1 Tax=Streptomyces catenulae TaxID=66875 RepID=UPI0004C15CB7